MAEATVSPAVRAAIGRAAGPDALLADADRFAVRGVVPQLVVAPASADDAAAVLAACSAEGWTVECAGAGTWLRQGRTPRAVDVVLSSSRIAGITEYEPADLTIGVRTGTSLDALHEATGAHGQEPPLDGPAAAGSTVGAMLATATAGPLRPAHGVPRDQGLGMEVVTGDGRVLRFGGRVVKNVAGYDIVRLLTGSFGTLGLITAAHLRLRARPERDVTLVAAGPARGPLLDTAEAAALAEPAALELLHGEAAGEPGGWMLLARLRGNAQAVADAVHRLRELAPALQPAEPAAAAAAWQRLARHETDASMVLRARTLRTTLAATADAVLPVAGETLPRGWTLAVHALHGGVRLLGPAAAGTWERVALDRFATALDPARAAVTAEGGTLQVVVPPPGGDTALDAFAVDAALLPLMRRLRAAFDPAGILAPGRFVL